MNPPMVTVITPTYNCANYLRETINSVIGQSYPNITYMIIDDGSTDETPSVLIDYQMIPRVCIIKQKNAGEQKAVNRGLELAQGAYFMIVNADDPLLPKCVEYLVNFMESKSDILCAYPDWRMIDGQGNILQHMKTPGYDFKFMVRHHWCLPSVGAMYRSKVLDLVGFRDAAFRWVGDFDYWLRVGLAGPMMRAPAELACWRKNDSQKSGDSNPERAAERILLMDKFYSLPGIPPEILKVKGEAYSWAYMVGATLSAKPIDKAWYLGGALRCHPQHILAIDFWYSLFKYAIYYVKRYWGH